MFKKMVLSIALVMGAFVAFGGSEAEAGYGYRGYSGYSHSYRHHYPVYRSYCAPRYYAPTYCAPTYYIPSYSYGCYGW